jgi:hypothetical protein
MSRRSCLVLEIKMRKIGIIGIILGSLMLLSIIGLWFVAYINGLNNLRKFGAEIYLPKLLLNVLNETWWATLIVLVSGTINILLGFNLCKEKLSAFKIWIAFYSVLNFCHIINAILFGFSVSLIFELCISGSILFISLIVLRKINFQPTASHGPRGPRGL